MQREQVDPIGGDLDALRRRKRHALEQAVDTLVQRGCGLDQRAEPGHHGGIALRRIGLGPEAGHERLPTERSDDLVNGWRRGSQPLPLRGIKLERIAVAPQRVTPRQIEEHLPLPRPPSRVPCERQRQAEVVEHLHEHRLARTNGAPPLELAIHAR